MLRNSFPCVRVLNFKVTNIKKKKKSPTLNFKVNKNQVLNFKIKKRQGIDFKVNWQWQWPLCMTSFRYSPVHMDPVTGCHAIYLLSPVGLAAARMDGPSRRRPFAFVASREPTRPRCRWCDMGGGGRRQATLWSGECHILFGGALAPSRRYGICVMKAPMTFVCGFWYS